MEEAILRGWSNLLHRLDGPMHFRFIIQPVVAALLGARAGLRDARVGEPPLLVALVRREHRARRRERLRHAWSDIGKVFIVAATLDATYQVWVHQGIFLLELLLTATLLALVPYGLVRGATCRLARAWRTVRARRRLRLA